MSMNSSRRHYTDYTDVTINAVCALFMDLPTTNKQTLEQSLKEKEKSKKKVTGIKRESEHAFIYQSEQRDNVYTLYCLCNIERE